MMAARVKAAGAREAEILEKTFRDRLAVYRKTKEKDPETLETLEKDALILDVLGQHVADHYVKGKRKEWDEYQTRVSSWELEKYLVIY